MHMHMHMDMHMPASLASVRTARIRHSSRTPRLWLPLLRLLRVDGVDGEGDDATGRRASACLLRADTTKRVMQTQRELISNYNELSRCLRHAGQAYARLLDERRPTPGALPRDSAELCPAPRPATRWRRARAAPSPPTFPRM